MKLRIGISDYELHHTSPESIKEKFPSTTEDEITLGYCDTMTKCIAVDKTLSVPCKKETLFHELAHAFLDEICYGDYSQDERFVDALGKQICGFFTRNNLEKIYKFMKIE